MEIITRQEAIAQGLRHFYTGEPCGRGHLSKRYLQGGCAECIKENAKKRMARIYSDPEELEAFRAHARAKTARHRKTHRRRWNAKKRERWANMFRRKPNPMFKIWRMPHIHHDIKDAKHHLIRCSQSPSSSYIYWEVRQDPNRKYPQYSNQQWKKDTNLTND